MTLRWDGTKRPYKAIGAAGSGIHSIIARFSKTTFSTRDYLWSPRETWQENLLESLAKNPVQCPLGLCREPSWVSEKHQSRFPAQMHLAEWVLTQADEKVPVVYAKAQIQIRGFRRLTLFVAPWQSQVCFTLWDQALSLLISGLFIGSEADMISIFPLQPRFKDSCNSPCLDGKGEEKLSSRGENKELLLGNLVNNSDLSPLIKKNDFLDGLERLFSSAQEKTFITPLIESLRQSLGEKELWQCVKGYEISATIWWQSPYGKVSGETLHYLKSRIDLEEKKNLSEIKSKSRARRKGIFRW